MLNTPQLLVGTPTKLAQAALTTSPVTVYTVPDNQRSVINDINICNTTSGILSFTILLGSAATTSNAMFYLTPINPNATIQWTGYQILNTAEKITVSASAAGLTATISGMESV